MIWLVFALLAGAAVLAVLVPLALKPAPDEADATDKAFYREQIAEIRRESADGRLSAADAEAARTEAARRLLRAADEPHVAQASSSRRARVVAAVATVVLVPALALPLYLAVGSAELPDMPLAQRQAVSPPQVDLAAAVARIEEHMGEHPDDGRGWEVVAPVYLRMGRYEDAIHAYGEALRLLGPTPARHAALGEAYVIATQGDVSPAARRSFEAALALDPKDPLSRYYLGLAAAQDGDDAKAREIWSALLADAPPGAGYRALVQTQIERLNGAEPAGPSSAAGKAVAALPQAEQQAMIGAMVERLATRLAQNGDDVEGWLKLLRAYSVMSQRQKAQDALESARKALEKKPTELARVEALASELNIGRDAAQ
jgi:cytochrome c-type biogenesis protein CcmH